jgi:Phage tail protein (Tail_P2_I)
MRSDVIARTLPWVVQAELAERPHGPLAALLEAMSALHERTETVLDELDSFFAPYRAPERFATWLAWWVDLAWLTLPDPVTGARVALPGGTGRLRHLLLASSHLSARQGTAASLTEMVDLTTGVPGSRVVDLPDQDFAVRLVLAPAAAPHLALVRRIVDNVQPAHVSVEITVEGEAATPDPAPDPLPHLVQGATAGVPSDRKE